MSDDTRRRRSARPKTNLPEPASSFVGRAADGAAIAERFDRGARLVTVTGPGGMGKTRLALHFASQHLDEYSVHAGGGVWFCDLTEARSVTGMAAVVAAALGVRLPESARESVVVEGLATAIARRGRMLLLLDNLEQLADAAGKAIAVWLASAPRCRLLVTSRVGLDVPGEEVWPLDPLPSEEAVDLFLRRARQLRPDLRADDAEKVVVAELVRALEGMPLAIELAASRAAILSPAQLLTRLERPLELLASRREVGRHTSVRRTVLDSVRLLDPAERACFARCAVFRDGFTLEAAERVIAEPGVMRAIESLARHSLLRVGSPADPDPDIRFSFFEMIREVAAELLEADPERDALRERHAVFYAALAGELGPEAAIHSGGRQFVRLGRELENLVVAHAHAVADAARVPAGPGAHRAVAIALGLEPALAARGLSRLRLRLLDEAIRAARQAPQPDQAALAEALLTKGLAKRELGDMDEARAMLEEGLDLAVAAKRPALEALAHARIGELVEIAGATAEAHRRFVRALALLAETPDDATRTLRESEAYMRIGHAHRREGGLANAETAVAEAIARYRRLGHDEGLASALYEAAVVAMFQGRTDAALARFDEGLAVAQRAGARAAAGALTTARGGLLQEMGRLDEALAHHAEAARVFNELGSRYRETSALYYLATAYLEQGDAAEAVRFLVQARARVQPVGSPRYEALIDGCHAVALACAGDTAAAWAVLARADEARSRCPTEPALGAALDVHRATVNACAEPASGPAFREQVARAARALVEAHPSDDSRFALRMLLAVLRPRSRAPRAGLVVWEGGAAFRAPHAEARVDLSRREPLSRILELLVQRRAETPGEGVPVEDIIGAGWPGERIVPQAALNRAYVALATLRKLGLREVLVTGPTGYWLTTAVPVITAE